MHPVTTFYPAHSYPDKNMKLICTAKPLFYQSPTRQSDYTVTIQWLDIDSVVTKTLLITAGSTATTKLITCVVTILPAVTTQSLSSHWVILCMLETRTLTSYPCSEPQLISNSTEYRKKRGLLQVSASITEKLMETSITPPTLTSFCDFTQATSFKTYLELSLEHNRYRWCAK